MKSRAVAAAAIVLPPPEQSPMPPRFRFAETPFFATLPRTEPRTEMTREQLMKFHCKLLILFG
jgi:hypothetical protein